MHGPMNVKVIQHIFLKLIFPMGVHSSNKNTVLAHTVHFRLTLKSKSAHLMRYKYKKI
jgi:hypothetical protein